MEDRGNSHVPTDWKAGLRSLGRVLSERDSLKSFDRCMVGGEGCKEPAIDAHCIPRTVLELIMNERKEVVGCDSTPPKNPAQWINDIHFKDRSVRSFSASAWACETHDKKFNLVDSKSVDLSNEHHLFLLVYKMIAYFTQRGLHSSERIAIPALDPAFDVLDEFPDHAKEGFKEAARTMSYSAFRVLNIKWKMDLMLNGEMPRDIVYRTAKWETTPTMAAAGMKFPARAC